MIFFADIHIKSNLRHKIIIENIFGTHDIFVSSDFSFFCVLGINKICFENFVFKIDKYEIIRLFLCSECNSFSLDTQIFCLCNNLVNFLIITVKNKSTIPPFYLYYKIEQMLDKVEHFQDILSYLFPYKIHKKMIHHLGAHLSLVITLLTGVLTRKIKYRENDYILQPFIYNTMFWVLRLLYKTEKITKIDFLNLFDSFGMNKTQNNDKFSIVEQQLNLLHEIKQKYKTSDYNKKKSRIKRIYNLLSVQFFEKKKKRSFRDFFKLKKIIGIEYKNIYSSANFPLHINLYHRKSISNILFKHADDIANDFTMVFVLEYLSYILKINIPSYKILLVDNESAIIEILPSEPLGIDHFQMFVDSHVKIQRRFLKSVAFCILQTYLFGIGDRNNDNFLVTNKFCVFQIDFSFILGNDPKSYKNTIENTIRIPSIIQYVLKSDLLVKEIFMKYFLKYYSTMRKNRKRINTFLDFIGAHPITKTDGIKEYLENRLFKDLPEKNAVEIITQKLENGLDYKFGEVFDFSNRIGKYFRK